MKFLITGILLIIVSATSAQSLSGRWVTSNQKKSFLFTLHKGRYVAIKLPLKREGGLIRNLYLFNLVYCLPKGGYTGKVFHFLSGASKKVFLSYDPFNTNIIIISYRNKKHIPLTLFRK
jgi:hypothetical protein